MNFIAMIRFTDAIILTQNSSIFAFTSEKVQVILWYCNCKRSLCKRKYNSIRKRNQDHQENPVKVFEFEREHRLENRMTKVIKVEDSFFMHIKGEKGQKYRRVLNALNVYFISNKR